MAFYNRGRNVKELENTGFTNTSGRLLNKNGSSNVIKTGVNPLHRFSIYHYMLELPNWKFFLLIFLFYTAINFIFAAVYYVIGLDKMQGLIHGTAFENFEEAYFFSAQTLTTVGYGRISPIGLCANMISSLEALIGIMTLAIITGLLYGRFVKPKAFISYSHNALVAPFKDGKALMFRLAASKSNALSDVSATVTLSMNVEEDGAVKSKFYSLPLQLDKVMSLTLSWTIVHPIDAESPLHHFTKELMDSSKVQLIVFVKAFDEGFSNTVVSRTSYSWEEIIYDAKFEPMFRQKDNNIMLELDKLNSHTLLNAKN